MKGGMRQHQFSRPKPEIFFNCAEVTQGDPILPLEMALNALRDLVKLVR
jgi:hypothetical protein